MKTISKYCETLRKAERYQDRLYNQYNHVRLLRGPLAESGMYIWEVN